MKIFLLALAFFFLSVFQLALAPRLSLWEIGPNFILAGVLSSAIMAKDSSVRWLILGWVLFFDLVAGRPFGVLALSFLAAFFFINWLANFWLKRSNFPAILFLGALGIAFFDLGLFLFRKIFSFFSVLSIGMPEISTSFFSLSLGGLYDLLAFLAIFYLLGRFKNFFNRFQR